MSNFKMPVSEYMTKDPVVLKATDSTLDAEAALDEHGITAVGVVDEDGKLVGVLSRTDLLRAADAESGETFRVPEGKISELMSKDPLTVAPDSPVDEAAKKMLKKRFHRVFVAGDDGKAVGVFSTRDVMRAVHEKKVKIPAIEIATTSVIKVKGDDPIALAVDRLDLSNRHGLIVTHDSWPVGTFSQVDALLARAKDPSTAVEEVMECRILALPPNTPLYRVAQQALAMNVRRVVLVSEQSLDGVDGVLSSFDYCRVVVDTMH
jgi:CBS domain-containing protein